MVPGGLDEEKATTKPAQGVDISQSETAVEAKAPPKKNMMAIAVGLFMFVLVLAAIAVALIFVLGGDGKLKSPHYDVFINFKSDDIVLAPKENADNAEKEAVKHENTLIWLHGRDMDAKDAAKLFA